MEVREVLENAIEKFNKKIEEDEKMASELEGMKRTIVIKLEDGGAYHFNIENGKATPLEDGDIQGDIEITSDSETLIALFRGEIGPMKAIATKKLKIKASIQDMLRIRKFF